ncbi:MAG: protease family protein [Mycobacterium sp.]|jgi:membrane protease YdiL (CAAX protease family)|nr:protease family protein [Mycobacterium sp.]MDT7735637.1 protease family protein [Mycobacterium sp.]
MTDLSAKPSALEEIRRGIVNVAVPHNEPPSVVRRRRVVVSVVLVLGVSSLALALRKHPGEPAFYWWTLALAGVWAIGAFASGPLHLGGARWRGRNQRPVVSGTVIGLLLGGVFLVGGLVVREIPVVAELVTRLLRYSDQGSWRLTMAIALLAAVAEEMFYRGALYTALGRHHPLLISTVIYALATFGSSRNPMLAFAAIILGTVCALERRATGGVLAPILTHFVWTLVVLLGLPPLFGL